MGKNNSSDIVKFEESKEPSMRVSSSVPRDSAQAEEDISLIQVISDPTRIHILQTLSEHDSLCGKDILAHFSITQPTLSHHMNLLCNSGLVDSAKDGKYVQYHIRQDGIGRVIAFFESLAGDKLNKADAADITGSRTMSAQSSVKGPALKRTPMLPTPKAVIQSPDIPDETIIENKKIKKKDKDKDGKKEKKKRKKN